MNLKAAALCLAVAALSSQAAWADIYMVKGTDGSITYTDVPPEGDYKVLFREGKKPPEAQPLKFTIPVETPSTWKETARKEAKEKEIDPLLVHAVIMAESAEDPLCISPKGAMGLMQLMPGTARELGVEDPFSPHENVKGGVSYLAQMLKRFDGNVKLALAAYNAGPGAVEKYKGIPPYEETRTFVDRVLKFYRKAKNQDDKS